MAAARKTGRASARPGATGPDATCRSAGTGLRVLGFRFVPFVEAFEGPNHQILPSQ